MDYKSNRTMLRQELHDAMLGVQQLLQSLPDLQQQHHQQEAATVASAPLRRDVSTSIISSSSSSEESSSPTMTSSSDARDAAQISAAISTAWYELRRAYRRLDRALTGITTNISLSQQQQQQQSSNQDQNMEECREDLLNVLNLATETCVRQRQSQSQPHASATTTTTTCGLIVDGGGNNVELQDLITSVCFTACRILGDFTSKLSLHDIDKLVDHVAFVLQPYSSSPLRSSDYAHPRDANVAPFLSSLLQEEQHPAIIPLLQLLHSNIGNQPRTNLRLGIQQQQSNSELNSSSSPPPPLVFPLLGPVESIRLLQLILPVALDTMQRHPWKSTALERNDSHHHHQNDLRLQLATFCNFVLEQVLTLKIRNQTNRDDDDDNDGDDQVPTKDDLLVWFQDLLWMVYQDQESSPSSSSSDDDLLSELVHQEATTLLQRMRDYVVTCMEFASDVVEGALITFFTSASSSSSSSAMSPSKRQELWEDVMHYTSVALNALQLLLQQKWGHSPNEHHMLWTSSIFVNQNDSKQQWDRLLSILQSVWSSLAKLVAAHQTKLDDPVVRQTTAEQLIRMGYQWTKMTALSSSTSPRPTTTSTQQQQQQQQDCKAITLFRACEYHCCPATCTMIQVMLEAPPRDYSTLNNINSDDDDGSEWKSVVQAATLSRLMLFSNDDHERQRDGLLRVMWEACLRLNKNSSSNEEDPWHAHLMAKMVQFNVVPTSTSATTTAAAGSSIEKVGKSK